jgi:site-specific recombinase XerD
MPPKRVENRSVRTREYLTPTEVGKIIDSVDGKYAIRNKLMLTMMYRHGLRVSELINLEWTQIDFESSTILVNRLKNGTESRHFLEEDEIAELNLLDKSSRYIFLSERGRRFSRRTVHDLMQKAGQVSGITLPVHPHMLRHSRGYVLANRGVDTRAIQEYLGHKNINHTVRYTALSAERFRGFGK